MIVILYFDKNYIWWVPILVESFNLYEAKVKFVFYTFNLSNKQINKMKELKNVIFVKNEGMEYDPLEATSWLYQLVCRKGKFIIDAMNRYRSDLFINMDVDMLLLRNLNDLKDSMRDNDIGFVRISEKKIMSGFIAIRNSNNSRKFIEEYYQKAMTGKLKRENDQPVLASLYEKYKDKMKFVLLTRQYLDPTYGWEINDPYILSAHKSYMGTPPEKYAIYKEILERMKKGKLFKKKWYQQIHGSWRSK